MTRTANQLAITGTTQAVRFSTRHAWFVILAFLFVAILSTAYFASHFAITTDSNQLLSNSLPWRQQERALDRAFPWRIDQIVAVIDASTPEAAEEAANILTDDLSHHTDVIRTVTRPDGGEFFARNGILFRSLDEVRRDANDLIGAQPFLGTLSADPTLRGVLRTLSQSVEGLRVGKTKLEDLRPALTAIGDALETLSNGKHPAFSWRKLITGRPAEPSDLRRFINIQPILDFHDLQPGRKATERIRTSAVRLGLTPERGVKVRLTGSVALADEEFSTIADGAALNGIITLSLVLLVLWLALRKAQIILAVFVNLLAGLIVTAGVGLLMVGTLNLISVAFAVLFVGLGVDFGIQFSVRYRAERFESRELESALLGTAKGLASPLLLAAASIAAGFYSFLPTAYVGLSELGLIAGTGMIIAFATTVTLLPALLAVLKPPGELEPIGYAALEPVNRFLETQRKWVVGTTLAVTILGLPLLTGLRFDFNPLDLRSRDNESVATLLDLMADPDTSPNTLDILEGNATRASALAERLRQLPEVEHVVTLQSFVPKDQDEKLAIIDDASFFLRNTLDPDQIEPKPTPTDTLAAIETTAHDLRSAAADSDNSPAAVQTRRLADALTTLATQPQAKREEAERIFVVPLVTTLRQVRSLLTAEHVTIETLPQSLTRRWVSADGLNRVEVAPSGDGNDNETLERFVVAVRNVAPDAAGKPVFVIEAAATIVKAFMQAAIWSVASIALILFITLRRWSHVALTLVPLLVAIVVTLEICVLIGLQLNFANIIALPLLLGVGVAFKIYYIMAWRAGERNFLQSSLTRAVIFSASTTATAFGSLWFSHHPGTSSMGKLMALCLITTLAAAVLFQPALLATQTKGNNSKQSA
jgi:hopanoid biosynthesis associated RND transporter like protein HpnN